MASALDLLLPRDVPGQVAELVKLQREMAENIRQLAAAEGRASARPENPKVQWARLAVTAGVLTQDYRTADYIDIVLIVASGSAAGLHQIVVANSIVMEFYLSANGTVTIELHDAPISVTRGFPISLVAAGATSSVWFAFIAQDFPQIVPGVGTK